MTELALLGCGNMGKAILKGLLEAKESPIARFTVSLTSKGCVAALGAEFIDHEERIDILLDENVNAASSADVAMLAFPPNQLRNALSKEGMGLALQGKLIISILAGTTISDIENAVPTVSQGKEVVRRTGQVPGELHVVRIMPSLGARAMESASLMVDERLGLPADMQELAEQIFACVGKIRHCSPELFDELTAVNGVCHAFMSVAVDALVDACVAKGIPRNHARVFAGMSWVGYAKLLAEGKEPAELKNSLLIPNGLTVQAMLALERGGVRTAVSDTVSNTINYTKAMNK